LTETLFCERFCDSRAYTALITEKLSNPIISTLTVTYSVAFVFRYIYECTNGGLCVCCTDVLQLVDGVVQRRYSYAASAKYIYGRSCSDQADRCVTECCVVVLMSYNTLQPATRSASLPHRIISCYIRMKIPSCCRIHLFHSLCIQNAVYETLIMCELRGKGYCLKAKEIKK